MRTRRLTLVLVPLVVLACADEDGTPVAPQLEAPPALPLIVDGSNTGLAGFYFQPPIVSGPPNSSGVFDPTIVDLLSVEICEWGGSGCVGPVIREITSESPLPERLRINKNAEVYQAVWDTEYDPLDPAKSYRVRVLASGGEIGHADVDVVVGDEPHDVSMARLELGDGLPIRFRITEALGERVGSEAATVAFAEGTVVFEIPEGALPEDVLLTATPATDLPPDGPTPIPGSAWDFGPDGLTFDSPVLLTISYDPADVPADVEESELRIHKLVDGEFIQAAAGVVDLENHTVSALVEGFSVFVILRRLYPGSPEDVEAPQVRSFTVLDPNTGTYGNSTTIDLSSADGVVNTRLELRDDISGVYTINLYYRSPSGQQIRFPCYYYDPYPPQPPTAGSDNFGMWDCDRPWPQYSEAGTWQVTGLYLEDNVGNYANYRNTPWGFCDAYSQDAHCLMSPPPEVNVVSNPSDTETPFVKSFAVSLDSDPRSYGNSVSVDASTGWRQVIFGFEATDDLSGIEAFGLSSSRVSIQGPSSQSRSAICRRESGTPLDGFWECRMWIPQFAEAGTWTVYQLTVTDRVGNGYWRYQDRFTADGSGNLCDEDGNCVTAPTVEVTSFGDGQAPFLQNLNLSVTDATVTITVGVTDDISGATTVRPYFRSVESTQDYWCYAPLVSGTRTNGTFECSITFPEFSARGQWNLSMYLYDGAGNYRNYYRRDSDGYLCYNDGGSQVCEDFGDTSVIIR